MTDNYRPHRTTRSFWEDLGLDPYAAMVATECFPEYWLSKCESDFAHQRDSRSPDDWQRCVERSAEQFADGTLYNASLAFRTDARHPAFWYAQGHEDYDEIAARAVAACAMVQLQREANPSPPPLRDNFAELVQALLLQGAMQRRLAAPDSGPESHEPFDPDDYPRFQAGGG